MIELVPLVLIIFYLVPFMVAAGRDHAHTVPLLVANVALGWTVVGWALLLWWALRGEVATLEAPKRPPLRVIPGEGRSRAAAQTRDAPQRPSLRSL